MNLQGAIKQLGFNPEKIAMNILQNNTNPMLNNLLEMINKGNNKGIENFARNFLNGQGRNFDTEFSDFMNQVNKMR